jgi:hypothetical protein
MSRNKLKLALKKIENNASTRYTWQLALQREKFQLVGAEWAVRSVGITPAVITAAVLSPAKTAADAFRPPARVSRVVVATSWAAGVD